MHILLKALLVVACLGPFAVIRFVAGVAAGIGCLAIILAGLFLMDSQPGVRASNPISVVTQHDYDRVPDRLWVRLPDGRILHKGE